MELKRVIALDSRAANEKAIQLYGENVLVISSERVDNQTELIVAVDLEPAFVEDDEQASPQVTNPSHAQASATQPARTETARIHSPDTAILSFSDWLQQGVEPRSPAVSPARALVKPAVKAADKPAERAPARTASRPTAPAETASPSRTHAPVRRSAEPVEPEAPTASMHEQLRSREVLALVREEFETLRKELLTARAFAAASQAPQAVHAGAAAHALMQALADMGVPLSLRTQLMLGLEDFDDAGQVMDAAQTALSKALERVREAATPRSAKPARAAKHKIRTAASAGGARIEVLAGPSGCGKTSMAVRLAAQAAAEHGTGSQAIVSFCDSRPGAWSQLQTLAALAGVDCWRAQNADSFKVILAELTQHHTVWVDTGGLDYMNTAQVLHELCPQASIHAVLPLDASFTSARRVLVQPPLAWSSLMLTKADESGHAWPLIATLCAHPIAVSCITHSARVQAAATPFDPQALAALAFAPVRESLAIATSATDGIDANTESEAEVEAEVESDAMALANSTLASLKRRAATVEVPDRVQRVQPETVPRAAGNRKRASTATESKIR